MEKNVIMQINRHVLTVAFLLLSKLIFGQSINYQDVDSMLIRFNGEWGTSACAGIVESSFIMYPNNEYLVTDRKNIKKLVKCVNSLDKVKNIDRSGLFEVECMIYFFQSDSISLIATLNEDYTNINGNRYLSKNLPSIIALICKSHKERQSRQTLTSNYIPFDGGESALMKYIEMKFGEMDLEECPSGEYDLIVSCHSDKTGNTKDIRIFHSSHNPKKSIPKILKKKIEYIFYQIKWLEDKSRIPSDDIIVKLHFMIK